MKLIAQHTKEVLIDDLTCAFSFVKRFKGLMFESPLETNQGLWIRPCNHVHTFFMKFPIDVVFLCPNHQVVYVQKNLAPFRLSKWIFKARSVIEVHAGWVEKNNVRNGDQLEVVA